MGRRKLSSGCGVHGLFLKRGRAGGVRGCKTGSELVSVAEGKRQFKEKNREPSAEDGCKPGLIWQSRTK